MNGETYWLRPQHDMPASGPYTASEARERMEAGAVMWPQQKLYAGTNRMQLVPVEAKLGNVLTAPSDDHPGCFTVKQLITGVDRTDGAAFVVRGLPIARRLARAMRDGKAVTIRGVLIDVNGQTYADTQTHVLGRILSADLKRLGY
jgi:hypothetical protein